jgi:hypothetical protein
LAHSRRHQAIEWRNDPPSFLPVAGGAGTLGEVESADAAQEASDPTTIAGTEVGPVSDYGSVFRTRYFM